MAPAPLLVCRPGATPAEVRAAYRAAVRAARPDLGHAGAEWLQLAQAERDALLRSAAPERRRRSRPTGAGAFLGLRRSTWVLDEPAPAVVVRL